MVKIAFGFPINRNFNYQLHPAREIRAGSPFGETVLASLVRETMERLSQKPTQKKQNKGLRIAKIIGNLIFYILILAVIAVGIIGIVGKLTGKENAFGMFGANYFVVVTPSMAHVNPDYKDFLAGHDDRIQVGDLIITRRIKKDEKLHLYDVVTFTEIKDGQKRTIVHRVVQIETGADGNVWYTTRGDSNNVTDGKRTIDEFSGILTKNAGQGWGDFVKFIQSYYGIAAVAGIVAVILITVLINDSITKKENAKKAGGKTEEEKKIDELFGDWKYDSKESDEDDEDLDSEDDLDEDDSEEESEDDFDGSDFD